MFVLLNDVPEELGPPHLVSRKLTDGLPAVPNWFRQPGRRGAGRFVDDSGGDEVRLALTPGSRCHSAESAVVHGSAPPGVMTCG